MNISFAHQSIPEQATRRHDIGLSTAPGAPSVVLIVRHAGHGNSGWRNALIKRANATSSRGRHVSEAQVERDRAELAELYARHVVVGFEHVIDAETSRPVPSSSEAALGLLTALIAPPPHGRPDVFVDLCSFCQDADNFAGPVVDAADLGKG
jgi:hypothetical protein